MAHRVRGIDVLRGAVMVLMAVDHVRVYAGVPAGGPDPAIFFTRWITHFCAPVFVFLAGTSAFLYGRRTTTAGLAGFLASRGLLLVALELTVIKFSWTFALDFSEFVLAGVIWMLGWCMVAMAALVYLPVRVVTIGGVAMMAVHQVFGFLPANPFVEFIYPTGSPAPGPIVVLYTLVPWVGVMAAGYGFGALCAGDPIRRNRWCVRIGAAATGLFAVAAVATAFTTAPDARLPGWIAAFNQQKYPPSQVFLLMTLGPALWLLPWADRATGRMVEGIELFGRVPMFYYLCHIPLIHLLALGAGLLRNGAMHHEWYATAPFASVPPDHRWTLGWLYGTWIVAIGLLYLACRGYAGYKAQRPGGWTRFV